MWINIFIYYLWYILTNFLGNKSEITAQLEELSANSNFVAKLEIENPAVKHLVVTNVLFQQDYDIFSPQYKLMETAIKKYLDEIIVPMNLAKTKAEINS